MYLNNKSHYSMFQAFSSPKQIIDFAKKNKISAIGLVDINTSSGFFEFTNLAKEENIKPILGTEISIRIESIVVTALVVAKNNLGIYEINKSISEFNERVIPTIDELTNCLIVITTPISETLNYDNVYMGVTQISRAKSADAISDKEIYIEPTYFEKNNFYEFQIQQAIKKQTMINKIQIDELRNNYLQAVTLEPKLINNWNNFCNQIEEYNYNEDYKIIKFPIEYESNRYLTQLAYRGLELRLQANKADPAKYYERLNFELSTILEMKFEDYFLIMWDIVKYCKTSNIYVGPGRGSAAGSLVSYCLGITNIDPIRYDLYFERFLNPKRESMPDIDLDVEDIYREQVVQYMINKYSAQKTAKIGTVNRYLFKSAFRDVSKAIGLEKRKVDIISKQLNSYLTIAQNLKTNPKLAKEFLTDTKMKFIYDYILSFEKKPRSRSIHASGVVITPEEIYNYCAINEENVTEVEAKTLEKMGIIKFDILALSALNQIHTIVDMIEIDSNVKIDVNKIDEKNEKAFLLLQYGLTFSIFQMESPGMIETIRKFEPQSIDDIATILALYRPGPMQYIDEYIRRKNGVVRPQYLNKQIREILESTYGIIVYQEQIMKIVAVVANYDLAQADLFRRAISKRDSTILNTTIEQFKIDGMKNGYSQIDIEKISEDILKFANYGFNKAHAYSYAYVVYILAYLKANYKNSYFVYLLQTMKSQSNFNIFENELKKMNIKVVNPTLKKSRFKTVVVDNQIILGFDQIKQISNEKLQKLQTLIEKHYSEQLSLKAVLDKIILPLDLDDSDIVALAYSGLFTEYDENEETIINYLRQNSHSELDVILFLNNNTDLEKKAPLSVELCEQFERQSLGFNIRYNSYNEYFNYLKTRYQSLISLTACKNNKSVGQLFLVLVKVENLKTINDKNGKKMGFLKVKDNSSSEDITIFSDEYRKFEEVLQSPSKFLIIKTKLNNGRFVLVDIVEE